MDVGVPPARRTWPTPAVLGWTSFGVVIALVGYAVVGAPIDGQPADPYVWAAAATGLFSSALAAVMLTRLPRHLIAWLFLVIGVTRAAAGAAQVWSVSALVTHPGRAGGALASWLQVWLPAAGLALLPLIIVLFPDGRLPGRGWRVVPVLTGVALVLVAVIMPIGTWSYRGSRLLPDATVPDDPFAMAINAAYVTGVGVTAVSAVIALAAMLARARRSTSDIRQQVKWFGLGAACALVANVLAYATGLEWLIHVGVAATFAGLGLGIFRFRLYEVDRLIRRTLLYGSLTLGLAIAFAAIDVTVAVVTGGDSPVAAAVAAFAVALLLRPARDWIQALVDRVYDRRAYDAVRMMRELAQRMGHEAVDPARVRDGLRTALHAPRLDVFYPVRPDVFVDGSGSTVDVTAGGPRRQFVPIRRGGQDIALITHEGVDEGLLAAVAPAAAAALDHARLQAELSVQLAELRASRGRIAAAGDAERRRIERDLHDGAQQRLVGLAVHIQSARRGAAHPPDIDALLTFTVDQLQAGVAEIRALVHGILPPSLVSGGLPAALAELGDVAVTCVLSGRPHPDIEATAWFVVCEGVANARKHAAGAPIAVSVSTQDTQLVVEVRDSGPGCARPTGEGLRHLADRVDAHGGTLAVHSPAGGGTRLTAVLPCG